MRCIFVNQMREERDVYIMLDLEYLSNNMIFITVKCDR